MTDTAGSPRQRRDGRRPRRFAARGRGGRRWPDQRRSNPIWPGRPRPPAQVVDATGLLVLPGAVDVHTHTRVAVDDRAGPVLPRFGRRGIRRDDDVPGVQQPGDGVVARRRAIAAGRAPRVARRDRRQTAPIDYGLSLADQRSHGRPARRAAGRRRRRRRRPARRSWSSTSGSTTGACSRRCGSWASTAGCSRSTARTRSCSMPRSRGAAAW